MNRYFVWATVIAAAVLSAACDGTQASSFSPTAPSASTTSSSGTGRSNALAASDLTPCNNWPAPDADGHVISGTLPATPPPGSVGPTHFPVLAGTFWQAERFALDVPVTPADDARCASGAIRAVSGA